MADLYGPAFGFASMGAALGDRFIAERDRDRQLALQDRQYQLAQSQDTRAQALANDHLLTTANQRADQEAALQVEGTPLGTSKFGTVDTPASFTPDGKPVDPAAAPAFGGTGMAMPSGAVAVGGATGKKGAAGPGAAVPVGGPASKIEQDVAQGKSVYAVDHDRLFQQAAAYKRQADALQAQAPDIMAKNPYPAGSHGALTWAAAMQRKLQAQIGAYQTGAEQAQTKAEASKAINYGKQAFFHLFAGDPTGAAPYLEALHVPKDMFVGMKQSKDGQYLMLKGGGRLTWEQVSAMTQGSPDDVLKAAEKVSNLLSKDLDRAAKITEAGITANPNKDPRIQAVNNIATWTDEYNTRKDSGENPASRSMKALEFKIADTKGAFNIGRDERADKADNTKKEMGRESNAVKLLTAQTIATTGSALSKDDVNAAKFGSGVVGLGANGKAFKTDPEPGAPGKPRFTVGQPAVKSNGQVMRDGAYPAPGGGTITIRGGKVSAIN